MWEKVTAEWYYLELQGIYLPKFVYLAQNSHLRSKLIYSSFSLTSWIITLRYAYLPCTHSCNGKINKSLRTTSECVYLNSSSCMIFLNRCVNINPLKLLRGKISLTKQAIYNKCSLNKWINGLSNDPQELIHTITNYCFSSKISSSNSQRWKF